MLTAFQPFSDFRSAAAEVLRYLHDRFEFSLWMVTRSEADQWIIFDSHGDGFDVKPGDAFRWTDSLCSQMVQGHGPCIAPQLQHVPAYVASPMCRELSIEAYIGLPLRNPDGTLFGTLCAIDSKVHSERLIDELPQFEMLSQMLATVLASESRAQQSRLRAEQAEEAAETDALTGLFNRRGWDRMLAVEESRCRRYGHIASVVAVDLDEFKAVNDLHGHNYGDLVLIRAAKVLSDATRSGDVVARVGGDEFAVLAIQCNQEQADTLVARLNERFSQVKILASVGKAKKEPCQSITDAWIQADQDMYSRKRDRNASRNEGAVTRISGDGTGTAIGQPHGERPVPKVDDRPRRIGPSR